MLPSADLLSLHVVLCEIGRRPSQLVVRTAFFFSVQSASSAVKDVCHAFGDYFAKPWNHGRL